MNHHLQEKNSALARHNTILALKLRDTMTKLDHSVSQQFASDVKQASLTSQLHDSNKKLTAALHKVNQYKAQHQKSCHQLSVMKNMTKTTTQIFSHLVDHLKDMANNIDTNVVSAWHDLSHDLDDDDDAHLRDELDDDDDNDHRDPIWDLHPSPQQQQQQPIKSSRPTTIRKLPQSTSARKSLLNRASSGLYRR